MFRRGLICRRTRDGRRRRPNRLRRPEPRRTVDLQLAGKIALISAASAGIGRATALALGREGAQTIILARRENELRALPDEIAVLGQPKPLVLVEDLLDAGSYDRVSSRVDEEFG